MSESGDTLIVLVEEPEVITLVEEAEAIGILVATSGEPGPLDMLVEGSTASGLIDEFVAGLINPATDFFTDAAWIKEIKLPDSFAC